MASWQAHLLSFILRHTFKQKLFKAKDALSARAVMNGSLKENMDGMKVTAASLGGVAGEWVEPQTNPNGRVLLYLHGGGYFACSPRTHRPYTASFARLGFRVYAPDYRLAPEHLFPAAVDDAVAVYRALRESVGQAPIAIGGDSAGGGLSLATMLRLKDEGDPLPYAAVLFSPLTDLAGSGGSRDSNSQRCAMFYSAGLHRVVEFYVPDGDPRHPLASPLYGDLHGLPPLLIHAGSSETLLDDSTKFAAKAEAAGVQVELKLWDTVPHVWQLFYRFVPEGRASLLEAGAFLGR